MDDVVSSNPIVRYFSILRHQLSEAPDYERVAFVLHHATTKEYSWDDLTDALAEIVPEQKEFWLRVQATWNSHFVHAMAHMLNPIDAEKASE